MSSRFVKDLPDQPQADAAFPKRIIKDGMSGPMPRLVRQFLEESAKELDFRLGDPEQLRGLLRTRLTRFVDAQQGPFVARDDLCRWLDEFLTEKRGG